MHQFSKEKASRHCMDWKGSVGRNLVVYLDGGGSYR